MSHTAAVVLAAGKGTRFRSELAKVLHPVAGRTMLRWVLDALVPLGLERVVVVVGHQAEAVEAEARTAGLDDLVIVQQAPQRGTGHAVRVVVEADVLEGIDRVLVLPGDVPLLDAETLGSMLEQAPGEAGETAEATVLSMVLEDPTGYGRILRNELGAVTGIVEERDATEDQRALRECNSGIFVFATPALAREVAGLSTANAQGEEYLTDVVERLAAAGSAVAAVKCPPEVVSGVNDRAQLAVAGAGLRRRILARLMEGGVTVVDPSTTYVDADVRIGVDTVLFPGSVLEGRTVVGERVRIGPYSRVADSLIEADASVEFSVLVQASVGPGATVGPYAYLRPGARLESGAKAGTFVEVKKSTIGEGSKVPHLSYVGDATIGKDVNVGAGTVTVNYDGREKHPTVVGDRTFIGSDTMLVAPVVIGADSYTGAGSVITKDVPDGALAVERSEQRIITGYTDRKRREKR